MMEAGTFESGVGDACGCGEPPHPASPSMAAPPVVLASVARNARRDQSLSSNIPSLPSLASEGRADELPLRRLTVVIEATPQLFPARLLSTLHCPKEHVNR